jgi:hypothetical protein
MSCVAQERDPLQAILKQNAPLAPTETPLVPTPLTPLTPPTSPTPPTNREWLSSEASKAPLLGMDLLLGQQIGIRPNVTLFSTEQTTLVAEGFYGALLTKFGVSEGAGAGVRWSMTRGGNDSVTFGPGLDVLFNFRDGQAVFLAPTIDFAWQHKFGERASFLLGINAGIGIGLSGYSNEPHSYRDRDRDAVSGKITPLISLFSGLRF